MTEAAAAAVSPVCRASRRGGNSAGRLTEVGGWSGRGRGCLLGGADDGGFDLVRDLVLLAGGAGQG